MMTDVTTLMTSSPIVWGRGTNLWLSQPNVADSVRRIAASSSKENKGSSFVKTAMAGQAEVGRAQDDT
ncbi:hypothetical protein ACU4GH_25060 [Bradyrhizobium betae]